jgi:two-component system, NarL family, response regulator
VNEERRCLVIDLHPTVRLGVRGLLEDRYEVEEAQGGGDALELLTSLSEFDVAIVELAPGTPQDGHGPTGLPAIRALRKARPGLGIVAHGRRPEHQAARQALDAGATAYVAKCSPADSLARAVDAAADAEPFVDPAAKPNGGGGITRRQREILQLYADGLSTAATAGRLGLSTETVRTHTKALLARLEARDRTHAVAIGLRNSLIE